MTADTSPVRDPQRQVEKSGSVVPMTVRQFRTRRRRGGSHVDNRGTNADALVGIPPGEYARF